MENISTIRIELDIAAQQILRQVMLSNKQIEADVEKGIKAAFEHFDFASETEKLVAQAIRTALSQQSSYREIGEIVNSRAKALTEKLADNYFDEFLSRMKVVDEKADNTQPASQE